MAYAPADQKKFDKEMANNPRFEEAYRLLNEGRTNTSIAKNFGVTVPTVGRWFKQATLPKRRFSKSLEEARHAASIAIKRHEEGEDADALLAHTSERAVNELRRQAGTIEDESLAKIAEAQSTPADKYQHYVAAAGIKLLRDGMQTIKSPRTVREMSELDQLIRRNLGLNAKNAGGNSSMKIDISILNNGIADRGNGAINRMMKADQINDAVIVPDEDK